MTSGNSLNWKDGLKIVLSVMTFGIGWLADNQAAVISFLALVIVWLVGLVFEHFKIKLGKAGLTGFVFAIAIILAYVFNPLTFPTLPEWTGDFSTYSPLLIAFLYSVLQAVDMIVAQATGVYNILLAEVLKKLPKTLLLTSVPVLVLGVFLALLI